MTGEDMMVYACHNLQDEMLRPMKVHITNNGEKSLCGFQHKAFSGSITEVEFSWLSQPDPDNVMCLKCRDIALRKLQDKEQK